ncbi:MAG TPA: DUF5343 domain-containing protein [Sphingomonadaceae bacterium]
MFPYTQNTGNLIDLIKSIGKHGVPDKFTTKELPIWGYKSSNDRPIVGVLKFIQFLDSSGAPTDLWRQARTAPEKAAASGVRTGYQALFQTFPDAERKDAEALTNFFKAKTTVGDSAVKQMVGTFKALAQYGDFSDATEVPPAPAHEAAAALATPGGRPISTTVSGANGMTVNLNVELSLPADATGDVYDAFFKAMKKHLLTNE